MGFTDDKFINLAAASLDKFSKKRPGVYNFRCPYCGDSRKHRNKARGYLIKKKGNYLYKCHNCGIGRSLPNFLKENVPHLYDEYIMEHYKEGNTGRGTANPAPVLPTFEKPVFKSKSVIDLTPVSELNNSHPARAYLLGRGIPEEQFDRLYYCPKFKEWTNKQKQVFADTNNDDARIIIPLMDQDGNLFGYQGRSLDINAKMRYVTIMLDEDAPKIFGLDKINPEETVYVTEGPFDSFFVPNSIAMCGSDVDLRSLDYQFVFVYDNEPRNKQIVEKITRAAEQGHKVVIFPKSVREKDLNDMVNSGINVKDVIESNIYQGLEAQLKLSSWKV